jgi:TfoX/Sxy family transcriptional regulator of competence genes
LKGAVLSFIITRVPLIAMASDQEFVNYVCEQARHGGSISSRRMFGEAALYCDGKVVGFVCDNQLFVKPTPAGRELLGSPLEAPPYPGARNYFLIAELDESDFVSELIRCTAQALPTARTQTSKAAPRAKRKKAARARKHR